jgi:hypothetical protein
VAATLPLEVGFKSSQRSSSDVLNISGLPILPIAGTGEGVGARIRQEWHPADDPQWDQLAAYNRRLRWVTIYGVAALTFMIVVYWLEHRGPVFIWRCRICCKSLVSPAGRPVRG